MDGLLRKFLTETGESPDNTLRLAHSIKSTCGFLELPRLEVLA